MSELNQSAKIPENATLNSEVAFPINSFNDFYQEIIFAGAEAHGSPQSFWGTSLLAATGTAMGKSVAVDDGKYKNYGQLNVINVAPSGAGKTEPMHYAHLPIMQSDYLKYEKYKSNLKKFEAGELEEKPIYEARITNDFTIEGLFDLMAKNPVIGIVRDELAGTLKHITGRYTQNSGELEHLLSCYDNKPVPIIRKGSEPIYINDPYLSICGTIQPQVITELIERNGYAVNGFAARFIYDYPEPIFSEYSDKTIPEGLTRQYTRFIQNLMSTDVKTIVSFTADAMAAYTNYYNELQRKKGNDDFKNSIFGKAQISVIRISLILQWIEASTASTPEKNIEGETMIKAINLSKYYVSCALKLIGERTYTKSDKIREIYRENPNLTQHEIAKMVGVNQSTVQRAIK